MKKVTAAWGALALVCSVCYVLVLHWRTFSIVCGYWLQTTGRDNAPPIIQTFPRVDRVLMQFSLIVFAPSLLVAVLLFWRSRIGEMRLIFVFILVAAATSLAVFVFCSLPYLDASAYFHRTLHFSAFLRAILSDDYDEAEQSDCTECRDGASVAN